MFFECCYGCEKRTEICHSTCKDYLLARAANEERNKEIRKQKAEKADIEDFKMKTIIATQRHYGRK